MYCNTNDKLIFHLTLRIFIKMQSKLANIIPMPVIIIAVLINHIYVFKYNLCIKFHLLFIGTLVFNLIPGQMLRVFTSDPQVIAIGTVGFHFVGISFIPMVTSLIFPVFFQAVGAAVKSSLLTVVRTVVLFVPLGYLFSRLGLNDFWFTFPVTEVITTLVGVFFYRRFMAQQK
jgi:Na+-driven multidrug efflux pump